MYMSIFLIICMSTLLHRIAEREKRRGWLWAAMTAIVMIVLLFKVGLSGAMGAIVGFVLMFALMTIANIYSPINKGPF
jgi:hypothetical protein